MSKKSRSKKSAIGSKKKVVKKVNGKNGNSIIQPSADSENKVILSIIVKQDQVDTVKSSLAGISPDIKVNHADTNDHSENSDNKGIVIQPPSTILKIDNEKHLTAREMDVLNRLAKGRINKEIADDLALQETTIKNYFQNIFRKFGVNNRTEANNRYLLISGKLDPIG